MAAPTDTGRAYHTSCTGLALETVKRHEQNADITLFGSCFCPFVQRVWVALEYLHIPYKMKVPLPLVISLAQMTQTTLTVDPYKKPQDLLSVSPKGLVPAIILHSYDPPRSLNESTVIMEYLDDLAKIKTGRSLLPPPSDPYARALVRLISDIASKNSSSFYKYLQSQSTVDQIAAGKAFVDMLDSIVKLFDRAEREPASPDGQASSKVLGLWKEGGELAWVDVLLGPWLLRATNVLKHYRGFELPAESKVATWTSRILANEHFAATCSDDKLYIDSYERYAFNRPNTSQVADAVNAGKALP